MDRLRRECPWDARQTHESLAPHLLEETYEALEALESGDPDALREELGDVLLQVFFHAEIASERTDGTGYTIDDVAGGIAAKLIRRHPHVFGDVSVSGADEVKRTGTRSRRRSARPRAAGRRSALDGVPFGQPALSLAAQLQRRAERAGVPAGLADLARRQERAAAPARPPQARRADPGAGRDRGGAVRARGPGPRGRPRPRARAARRGARLPRPRRGLGTGAPGRRLLARGMILVDEAAHMHPIGQDRGTARWRRVPVPGVACVSAAGRSTRLQC